MAFPNPTTCAAFGQCSTEPNYSTYFGLLVASFPASQAIHLTCTLGIDGALFNSGEVILDHSTAFFFPWQFQTDAPLGGTTEIPWNGGDSWGSDDPLELGTWAPYQDPYPGLRSDLPGAAFGIALNDGSSHVYELYLNYAGMFHYGPDGLGTDEDLYLWDITQKVDGDTAVVHGNVLVGHVPHGAPASGDSFTTLGINAVVGWVDDLTVTYDGGGGGTITHDFQDSTFGAFTEYIDPAGIDPFQIACPPFGGGGRDPRAGCTRCGSGLMGLSMRTT